MQNNQEDFRIRIATAEDVKTILEFIKELAAYEHLSDDVIATEEALAETIFVQKKAEVLIGEYQSKPAAFALFFHNYSTFLARPGIYLEDLFVKEEYRGLGFGSAIFTYLAQYARDKNYGRLEWACLDWNEPSIKFYKQQGAVPLEDWTVYRLQGTSLTDLASGKKV